MKNFEEKTHAHGAEKKWKKALIIGLCLVGVAAFLFACLLCGIYYEKHYKIDYWEGWSNKISPAILLERGYVGMESFEQLKDIRTGKHTTPRLNHIFVNENNTEDSLVVFRTKDHLRGYLNINTGMIIIPAQYQRAWNFSEGVAAVYKEGVVSFIDANGEPAIPRTFPIRYDLDYDNIAFQFHDGLCVMRTMNNKWGLIDMQGEWLVEPVYNSIDAPVFGYRKVTDGKKYGLLTVSGKLALPLEYDEVRVASDQRGFILVKDGTAKEVDTQFNTLVPFVYDGLYKLGYVQDYRSDDYYDEKGNHHMETPKFWRYDIGVKSGVMDATGKVIIPAIYYMVYLVDDHLFQVEVECGGDRILFDHQGRYVGKASF